VGLALSVSSPPRRDEPSLQQSTDVFPSRINSGQLSRNMRTNLVFFPVECEMPTSRVAT